MFLNSLDVTKEESREFEEMLSQHLKLQREGRNGGEKRIAENCGQL